MKVYENNADYIRYLIKKDPNLKELFESPEKVEFELTKDYFRFLLTAIVFQQLSGKVAQIIFNRILTLFENDITPAKLLEADFDKLRECGLSARKISYMQNAAELIQIGTVHFEDIDNLNNQEVIDMVTKIKGIGPWTADMFLMTALGRDNIFSVLDLGLRNALNKLYKKELTKDEMIEISKLWDPYQSVVSHYLWRYLER